MSDSRHHNATFLRKFVPFVSCLALLVLLPGCGAGGSGSGGQQQNPPPGLIGVAGGSLTSTDGKVTLVVPPNAVSNDTQFTIAPANGFPPSGRIAGTVYDIGPTGTSFPAGARPQLTMALPAGVNAATATIGTLENGQWDDVPGSAVNQAAQTVTASLEHLSPYAVLGPADEPNQDPIANAGGPYEGEVGIPVTLIAAGSSDPNNDPLTYTWDFGDGATSDPVTSLTTFHTYTSLGEFPVTLTVSDGRGGTGTSNTVVLITNAPQNAPPIADAGGPYVAEAGGIIPFSAAGSIDPDSNSMFYHWDFGDGGSADGIAPMYAYTSDGTWPVTVTVTDSVGASDQDTTTATISPATIANRPPVITGMPTIPATGLANEPLTFDVAATDDDGHALTYRWTFGDGSSTGPRPLSEATYAYAAAGTFTVTVMVDDGHGGTDFETGTVTILTPNRPVAFSYHYPLYLRQTVETGAYKGLYAITLGGSGMPPLRFNIVSFPTHQIQGVPMDVILNQYYQWWDPGVGWICRDVAPASCRSTMSTHVDLASPPLGTVLVCPGSRYQDGRCADRLSDVETPVFIGSPVYAPPVVVYVPQDCNTWTTVPRTDFFTFSVTDATGQTSDEATISFTMNDGVCRPRVH